MKLGTSDMSLGAKFILASVAVIVITTSLMCLLVLDRFRGELEDGVDMRAQALAGQLGALARLPLRAGDRESLDKIARDALLVEDLVAVEFKGVDGETLASVVRPDIKAGRSITNAYPVFRRGSEFKDEIDLFTGDAVESEMEEVGKVTLEFSLASIDRAAARMRARIFSAAAILAAAAILVSVQFARRFTDPIRKLMEGVEKIGSGGLDQEIEVGAGGEIGALADHVNQMSRDLRKSVDQMIQQEKMATLGRMASCVSHEIGSPLNSIMFSAANIIEEVQDGPARDNAESIALQTRRMRDTIRNLLDYARAPSDAAEEVNLARALDEALLVLAAPIKKAGFTVEKDLPLSLPRALAVKNLCVQVFINVVKNAMEAAGPDGKVVIRARALDGDENGKPDMIEVSLQDNGPGLPGEEIAKIFEPFYTSKPEGQGTGLGLTVCAQIMSSQGGSIRAETAEGEGSIFYLEFQAIEES